MSRTETLRQPVAVGDTMFLAPYHDHKLPDGTKVSIRVKVTKVTPSRITVEGGEQFTVPLKHYKNHPDYGYDLSAESFKRHGSAESWYSTYLRRHPGTGFKVMTREEYLSANANHAEAEAAEKAERLRKLVTDVGLSEAMVTVLSQDMSYTRGELRALRAALEGTEDEAGWDKALEDALVTAVDRLNTIRSAVRGIASRLGDLK